MLQRLNYHHLMYFWMVAREGGLVKAAKVLRLSPPTVSGQIHSLEEAVGHRLFVKAGRRLSLTEVGEVTYRYADEIFALGQELGDVLARRVLPTAATVRVGLVEEFPKTVVRRLLEPLLTADPPARLVCREGNLEQLAAGLGAHAFDVILGDAPLPSGSSVRAYNHLLGHCGTTFFATKDEARRRKAGFPASLHDAPMLVPLAGSVLRRELDAWFDSVGVVPRVVAEIEDSALMKAFGASGRGVFTAPSIVATEVAAMYDVAPIGQSDEVVTRFYAISAERRIRNPAVAAISEAAKERLFA